jgi:hypothetical protein
MQPEKKHQNLDSSLEHYDHLHGVAHGTALVWERATANRWHKLAPGDAHIPALLAAQTGQPDRYVSANEFHGWRLVALLKSLRCCYVDIDGCQDAEHTLGEALERLREAQLPPPSAVVFSGRGLHLYWLIEPVPAKALAVWQRCQDVLIAALRPLGADPVAKDCTRVLRLVGSVNSKNGAVVRGLVFDPQPYGFRHLCDEVLGYRVPRTAEVRDMAVARAERGQRLSTGSIYDRWHVVYRDLRAIAESHLLGGVPHGHRDKWLFLSAVALSWFANPQTLARELEKQASNWTPGLSMAEVRSAIKGPVERAEAAAAGKRYEWEGEQLDPRFRFRRETLWDWMRDAIPAELVPELRAIVPDDVRAEHKRETDAKRWATHHADSAAQKKPWEALGISRRTYYNRKARGTL